MWAYSELLQEIQSGDEERGQASQHIPPFGLFLIQVCAANHAQDTGTEALDFLSD